MAGDDDIVMRIDALRSVVGDMTSATNWLRRVLADLQKHTETYLHEERWSGLAKQAHAVGKANWDSAANTLTVLLGQCTELLAQIVEMFKQVNDGVVRMWRQYAR
jgi:uncharacterized protein YukE